MNQELELKLQAHLDGELSAWQARKTAAWIERDPEAQSLLAELRMTKTAFADAEPEMELPESREFYWNKIERGIELAEQAQTQSEAKPVPTFVAAWRKWTAPLAGTALIAFLTVYTFRMYDDGEELQHHTAVVENLSEHTGAYSFRSQSEKMFVVWLYDRSEESAGEPDPADDQPDQ